MRAKKFEYPTEFKLLKNWFKTKSINQLIGFENSDEDGDGD